MVLGQKYVGLEVLTAVTMKSSHFWDMTTVIMKSSLLWDMTAVIMKSSFLWDITTVYDEFFLLGHGNSDYKRVFSSGI
jgi:hypothetical protein